MFADDPDGPACYYCSKEVLPFRTTLNVSDSTRLTGVADRMRARGARARAEGPAAAEQPPARGTRTQHNTLADFGYYCCSDALLPAADHSTTTFVSPASF